VTTEVVGRGFDNQSRVAILELRRDLGALDEVPRSVRYPTLPEDAPCRLRRFPKAVADAVLLEESGDPADAMRIAHLVLRADASFRRDRRGLGKDQGAPPTARVPKCTRCHWLARPFSLEYSHIGETAMRLERVTPRRLIASNRWAKVVLLAA
jgi:hypothetical protein